jgi:hypothetical protein
MLDLLGQLTCRGQPQGPLEQLIGFRLVGAALDRQQALGIGEQVDWVLWGQQSQPEVGTGCGPTRVLGGFMVQP